MAKKRISSFDTTMTFIIFMAILTTAIIGMFMFIKLMGENTKYPNEKDKPEKTTTTVTTTKPVEEQNEISYVAKLSDIIGGQSTKGNYSLSINYQDTYYYFKCISYDGVESKCNSGIALLQFNNVNYPLFVFESSDDDFLNNGKNYYIVVTDDNVVLTYNNTTHIYKNDGEELIQLNNIITEYKTGEESTDLVSDLYPSIDEDKLNYYTCDDSDTSTVYRRTISLDNKKVLTNDIIENGVC